MGAKNECTKVDWCNSPAKPQVIMFAPCNFGLPEAVKSRFANSL